MSNCDDCIGELADFIERQEPPEMMPVMVANEASIDSWARMLLVRYRNMAEFIELMKSLVDGQSNSPRIYALKQALECCAFSLGLYPRPVRIAEAVAA